MKNQMICFHIWIRKTSNTSKRNSNSRKIGLIKNHPELTHLILKTSPKNSNNNSPKEINSITNTDKMKKFFRGNLTSSKHNDAAMLKNHFLWFLTNRLTITMIREKTSYRMCKTDKSNWSRISLIRLKAKCINLYLKTKGSEESPQYKTILEKQCQLIWINKTGDSSLSS